MAEPFLGEIHLFSFDFAPRGYAHCDGQLLSIVQNQALYALLGNTYGGDGHTTFALPDLRGRVPQHRSPDDPRGASGGEEQHTLTLPEMPAHSHPVRGSGKLADQLLPGGHAWARHSSNPYAAAGSVGMAAEALATAGESQPHENRQPYRTLNFCIALQGVFPSRN